jgi:hypothetical protein
MSSKDAVTLAQETVGRIRTAKIGIKRPAWKWVAVTVEKVYADPVEELIVEGLVILYEDGTWERAN